MLFPIHYIIKKGYCMDKIDYKREMKELYSQNSKAISVIQVPQLNFIMIDGKVDRNSEEFKAAWDALVRTAYTIKFIIKSSNTSVDYVTMPVEGLWLNNLDERKDEDCKAVTCWKLCIMQPPCVKKEVFDKAIEASKKKKGISVECLDRIYFKDYSEGLSIQTINIGPYDSVQDSLDKLQAYMEVNNYTVNGLFHEIYIGDSRRARPENLKTILRQPIKMGTVHN
jgi:hypothetical protein